MPSSPTALILLPLAVAAAGVFGCQTTKQSRPGGIETGAIGTDTVPRDTSVKTDTAKPVEPGKVRVSNVMIGKRLGTGDRISEPTLQFAPSDTVFISVASEGKPDSATLSAKWTFPTGRVQDSASKTIKPTGTDRTELHTARPDGWSVGSYLVTIYANGDSVDAKTFAVRK